MRLLAYLIATTLFLYSCSAAPFIVVEQKKRDKAEKSSNTSPTSTEQKIQEKEKTADAVVTEKQVPPASKSEPDPEPKSPSLQVGIGITWGNWLGFGYGDKARKSDRLTMNKIASLGAHATTANFAWIDIEEKEGTYNWSYADHQVEEANKRNLEIYAYIGLTPDWALDKTQIPKFFPGIGYRYPPATRYQGAFEKFFEETAKRYKGKVKNFKFWNEPNGCSWVGDGCSNGNFEGAVLYVKWLKIAYQALKKGNPEVVVSIGGLDYNSAVTEREQKGAIPYLKYLYQAGAKGYFDALTLHPYGEVLNYEALEDNYAIMKENGDENLPIWIGEYGWSSKEDGISEEMKKENISQILPTLTADYPYVKAVNYLILTDLPNEDGADAYGYGLCSRFLDKLDGVTDENSDDSVIKCRASATAIADFTSQQ